MGTEDQLVELFLPELEEVFRAGGLKERQQRYKSRELVEAAATVFGRSEDHLIVLEEREGESPLAVHYNPVAAAAFLAALISAVLSAGHWIVVGCAVVGCLASLKGLRDTVSRAEGILFAAIYQEPRHVASRKQAQERFEEFCKIEDAAEPTDFSAALQGLLDLGCIKESDGNLRVDEVVIVW